MTDIAQSEYLDLLKQSRHVFLNDFLLALQRLNAGQVSSKIIHRHRRCLPQRQT